MPDDRQLVPAGPASAADAARPVRDPVSVPTPATAAHHCPMCSSYDDHDEWTALLIAPAAFHRVVYRKRLKLHLVQVANRLALFGG